MRRTRAGSSCLLSGGSQGSRKGTCSVRLAPGKTGHAACASSQTVTKKSKSWPAYSSSDFDHWVDISTPASAMDSTTRGQVPDGCVPAENTSSLPAPKWRIQPSAIWERALFPVQATRMRGLPLTIAPGFPARFGVPPFRSTRRQSRKSRAGTPGCPRRC